MDQIERNLIKIASICSELGTFDNYQIMISLSPPPRSFPNLRKEEKKSPTLPPLVMGVRKWWGGGGVVCLSSVDLGVLGRSLPAKHI